MAALMAEWKVELMDVMKVDMRVALKVLKTAADLVALMAAKMAA